MTRAMRMRHGLVRFFRTPKGILILLLLALLLVAVFGEGEAVRGWQPFAATVAAAAIVDLVLLRWWKARWEFPSGAVLTGMLVGMVMSPHEPWYVGVVSASLAVSSKYVLRTRSANMFNPAALALVGAYYGFKAGHSWWGALPDMSLALSIPILLATGVFIAHRVNKLPLVLTFLGVFYGCFTTAAFAGDPARVAEAFITPDLQAALFFAFFILTDPPTSPTRPRDQVLCGVVVAVVSVATYLVLGVVFYLLAGVLAGNAHEAWRRAQLAGRRQAVAA